MLLVNESTEHNAHVLFARKKQFENTEQLKLQPQQCNKATDEQIEDENVNPKKIMNYKRKRKKDRKLRL